jgi:rhodanese-related sulfurtransferase
MVQHADVTALAAALQQGATVIDVREGFEYTDGHVPGAVHIPMGTVPGRVEEFRADEPVYVICRSGNRSHQVGLFLERHGIETVNVSGGTDAWQAAGFPVHRGASA